LPFIPDTAPRWGNALTRGMGRLGLRLMGWRIEGDVPAVPQFVAIGAPHTATADAWVALWSMLGLGLRIFWMGKREIFRWPFAGLLRWLGGIPVERSAPGGTVGQAVDLFRQHARCIVALAPEGTRKKVERWRTGYHRIAVEAGVPIVPVALDYSRHVVDIGRPYTPTGDYATDEAALRAHYRAEQGRHPERF
jgi:1-acyl-sn-glycerol-3-phosphate acyltransferase